MDIWDLPTTVIEEKILSSLSARDIAALGQVSKRFYDEVQVESVWEAMYHHHYGPRTPILKRAAEIAGGYHRLYRASLLTDRVSGRGVHQQSDARVQAFTESVVGSGDVEEGPGGLIFLVDTSYSMASSWDESRDLMSVAANLATDIVSAALLKNPTCLTGILEFHRQADINLPLELRSADEFKSGVSNLSEFVYIDLWSDPSDAIRDAQQSHVACGAHLAPAMALVREEIVRAKLPLAAPKCVVVISDGLWSPNEVAEAQEAAAELCRGDLGPIRVFGVGVGLAARMDEFRGMLEAQGSLPPQASARYLTLLSGTKPFIHSSDLGGSEADILKELAKLEGPMGIEVDFGLPEGTPRAHWGPPPAWLVARLPSHKLRLTLSLSGLAYAGENLMRSFFGRLLSFSPWMESIIVLPGKDDDLQDLNFGNPNDPLLPYSELQLESFTNLRELALYNPDSIPAIPSLEILELRGLRGAVKLYSPFEDLTNLKELEISAFDDEADELVEELYKVIPILSKLERLELALPGPIWTLPDFSSCKRTLEYLSFSFGDIQVRPRERHKNRQKWLAEAEGSHELITISDCFHALSDCTSLNHLEFEVMSAKGLEGIEQLAGLPRLRTLFLVCSMPIAEWEKVQDQCLAAFSALKQVQKIYLRDHPYGGWCVWWGEYTRKEPGGTLEAQTAETGIFEQVDSDSE